MLFGNGTCGGERKEHSSVATEKLETNPTPSPEELQGQLFVPDAMEDYTNVKTISRGAPGVTMLSEHVQMVSTV